MRGCVHASSNSTHAQLGMQPSGLNPCPTAKLSCTNSTSFVPNAYSMCSFRGVSSIKNTSNSSFWRSACRVSITTCLISILGLPALYVYGKEGVPMAGQVAVMGTALAGTGSSTLLLNLCVSPYVFRMAEVGPRCGTHVEVWGCVDSWKGRGVNSKRRTWMHPSCTRRTDRALLSVTVFCDEIFPWISVQQLL